MGNGNTYIGVNSNNSWNCLYATLAPTSENFIVKLKMKAIGVQHQTVQEDME